jgi:hypothetical protein
LVLLSLALLAALQWLWRLRLGIGALAAGGLLWWAVLAYLAAAPLPGFGYVFALPLIPAALAAGWNWWRFPTPLPPWPQAIILAVPAFVTILLVTPIVYGLAVFAGRMEAMMGVPLAALPLPFVVFTWALLPQVAEFLTPARRWSLAALLLGAAVLLLAVGWLRSGFDSSHPKLNTAIYWLDADRGTARWLTVDDSRSGRGTGAQLDTWTGQFFTGGATPTTFNPWLSGWFTAEYPALAAPAPPLDLPASAVRLLASEDMADGGRLLHLEITPAGDVQDLFLELRSAGGVRLLSLDDTPLAGAPAPSVRLNIAGHPQEPLAVTVRTAGDAPLAVEVRDRRLGLPANALAITPRPPDMAAAPFNDASDSTIVAHTATFE